ncbi:hypothetical protein PM082_000005 [Marasmius tenuissimus]|nr:hypothetical protein PM082_000005 [Marasmius tenuissimus]
MFKADSEREVMAILHRFFAAHTQSDRLALVSVHPSPSASAVLIQANSSNHA